MIIFENSGEIDLRTVSTFGCSVKESKNPIGYFGTGLKFALAVLLRAGHKITIQSGLKELQVTSRNDLIRGKDFSLVYLGESPAGFTTELGKNWEVWMAYRELHCNAKDEPESKIFWSGEWLTAKRGVTRLIVEGDAIEKAHNSREDFILESQPIAKLGSIEVHSKPSSGFFYRGIKVVDFQKPAMFTYNQTDKVELTEDRTAKDPYSVAYAISRAILSHGESSLLEKVLTATDNNIESVFDYHGWSGHEPGRDFFPTVAKLQKNSLNKINQTALKLWREKGGGIISPRRINATEIQAQTLEKAISFCEDSGFMVRNEYPIFIVETLGEAGCMAMADMAGKQIFLTEYLFSTGGTKGVARALIEEYAHLKFGYADCTREMQNFLFGKVISLAEELTGEPL